MWYMLKANIAQSHANKACSAHGNFTNVEDVKFWVNGTWYGDLYFASVMQTSGLNQTELTAFYADDGT